MSSCGLGWEPAAASLGAERLWPAGCGCSPSGLCSLPAEPAQCWGGSGGWRTGRLLPGCKAKRGWSMGGSRISIREMMQLLLGCNTVCRTVPCKGGGGLVGRALPGSQPGGAVAVPLLPPRGSQGDQQAGRLAGEIPAPLHPRVERAEPWPPASVASGTCAAAAPGLHAKNKAGELVWPGTGVYWGQDRRCQHVAMHLRAYHRCLLKASRLGVHPYPSHAPAVPGC